MPAAILGRIRKTEDAVRLTPMASFAVVLVDELGFSAHSACAVSYQRGLASPRRAQGKYYRVILVKVLGFIKKDVNGDHLLSKDRSDDTEQYEET
jgi:hypothetical protein